MAILFSNIAFGIVLFDILLAVALLLAIANWIFPKYGIVLASLAYAGYRVNLLVMHPNANNFILTGVGCVFIFGFCKFWQRPFPDALRWVVFVLAAAVVLALDLFVQA